MPCSEHGKKTLKQDIENRVVSVVREVLAIEGDIDLEASIVKDLAPESLDQVRLFMTLEDEFEDTIPDEDLVNIGTLNQVINYIEKRMIVV